MTPAQLGVYTTAQVDSAVANRNLKTANLSDVSNVTTARTNLSVYSKLEVDNFLLGKVTDAIVNGVTTVAPSQNAVFDALALKADSSDVVSKSDVNDQTIQSNFVAKNYLRTLSTPTELNEMYVNGFYEIVGGVGSGGRG